MVSGPRPGTGHRCRRLRGAPCRKFRAVDRNAVDGARVDPHRRRLRPDRGTRLPRATATRRGTARPRARLRGSCRPGNAGCSTTPRCHGGLAWQFQRGPAYPAGPLQRQARPAFNLVLCLRPRKAARRRPAGMRARRALGLLARHGIDNRDGCRSERPARHDREPARPRDDRPVLDRSDLRLAPGSGRVRCHPFPRGRPDRLPVGNRPDLAGTGRHQERRLCPALPNRNRR